jgi:hypothetical protein
LIYWKITSPRKSWDTWSDGTAADEDEARVDAIGSVMDDNGKLLDWALRGVSVQMWRCIDIEDYKIDEEQAALFRRNYLGV